jgi:hypothetical protein
MNAESYGRNEKHCKELEAMYDEKSHMSVLVLSFCLGSNCLIRSLESFIWQRNVLRLPKIFWSRPGGDIDFSGELELEIPRVYRPTNQH